MNASWNVNQIDSVGSFACKRSAFTAFALSFVDSFPYTLFCCAISISCLFFFLLIMGFLSLSTTFIFFASAARALNDWTTPCHNGTCTYDVVNDTASGTVTIVSVHLVFFTLMSFADNGQIGNVNAISDLTTAGGWTLMDYDKNSNAQDMRAVCTGTKATSLVPSCDFLKTYA